MLHKWSYIAVSVVLTMIVVSLIVFFAVSSSAWRVPDNKTPKQKLIIDHDGGADDAMAIFMALLYERHFNGPEVVALTTVHGNVDERQVFNNSQRILNIADRRDVPIYRGSKTSLIRNIPFDIFFGRDGLGDSGSIETFETIEAKNDHAAVALIELSKKYKDNLIIVTIGALTNIALAVKLDPDFISRISHLYVGAGNVYGDDYKNPEFNAAMDVESYYVVTENANPNKTTVIPFSQVQNNLTLSKDWRNNQLGSINTKIMKSQNNFEQISLKNNKIWCLLDPAVMAIALDDSLVVEETSYSNHSIVLCGNSNISTLDDKIPTSSGADRGVNINTFTSLENANVALVNTLRKDSYQEFLMDLFSSELTD